MAARILATLTIGQSPRRDIAPVIARHVPPSVRLIDRGALDGLSRQQIAKRYEADPDEAALVTRLQNGDVVNLSRRRMRDGVQAALTQLEAEGCDVVLLLCTGTFEGLECRKAWLVEPDHIIPPAVAGLVERRRLGVIVPIPGQIESEADKWQVLPRPPLLAWASPYDDDGDALLEAGRTLQARGAEALLLDCIGFTERHRAVLALLGLPVIVSNALAAKAVGELLEG
ncbi:MAG: AroM family protein [Alphaproteobacteria bacterium]|nr:AroM family protein [Alphaproteobacteria bacterium]